MPEPTPPPDSARSRHLPPDPAALPPEPATLPPATTISQAFRSGYENVDGGAGDWTFREPESQSHFAPPQNQSFFTTPADFYWTTNWLETRVARVPVGGRLPDPEEIVRPLHDRDAFVPMRVDPSELLVNIPIREIGGEADRLLRLPMPGTPPRRRRPRDIPPNAILPGSPGWGIPPEA